MYRQLAKLHLGHFFFSFEMRCFIYILLLSTWDFMLIYEEPLKKLSHSEQYLSVFQCLNGESLQKITTMLQIDSWQPKNPKAFQGFVENYKPSKYLMKENYRSHLYCNMLFFFSILIGFESQYPAYVLMNQFVGIIIFKDKLQKPNNMCNKINYDFSPSSFTLYSEDILGHILNENGLDQEENYLSILNELKRKKISSI